MSLSRTTSLANIPEQVLNLPKGQNDPLPSDSNNKQQSDAAESDNSTNSSKNSTADQKNSNKKPAPVQKLKAPVVRQKLTHRQRSTSSPVIHRPLPPSSSSKPDSTQTEISSPPKLKDKKLEASPKTLTADQQLASDLADLLERMFLRKQGRFDDPIDLSQATINLQRQFDKKKDEKVLIENITLKMFSDDLKKLGAWTIAQDIVVKIRINYFQGHDISDATNPAKQKEITGMLGLLSASLAGAFFNISGKNSTIRLPDSLTFFLREIDHRQIRILLSDDKGIAMSQDNFIRLRKEWMAKVLIDAFLVPLVQKEFFSARGTLTSDHIVSQIISALHNAFAISANEILSDSLKSAPADIQNLVKKRRTTQFKQRENQPDKSLKHNQPAKETSISTSRPVLVTNTSPSRQRRSDLSKLLKKLISQLRQGNVELTSDMLIKIKEFNNEFALSNQPISKVLLYQAWLDIVNVEDTTANPDFLKTFKGIVDDVVEEEKEQATLTQDLLEIDIYSKLNELEKSGNPLTFEKAKRLSSDVPLNLVTTPTYTPLSTPTQISKSTFSPTSPSPTSIQKSPRSRPLNQHRRMRTADVSPINFSTELKGLSSGERSALTNALPDLLIDAIQRAAFKKVESGLELRKNPISEIIASGRDKLLIPLDNFTKVLREKIQALSSLSDETTAISHADLLKILMLDEFKLSPSGKLLHSIRQKALQSEGSSQKPNILDDQPRLKAEKTRLLTIFNEPAEQIASSLFNADLSQSGLPKPLLTLWKSFDKKLVDWVGKNLTVSAEDLDKLRSTLAFDLIVTRLVYPLCIGIGDALPTLAATSLADAVRQSTLQKWGTFFQAFKNA
jgi:hypothetical protein